MKIRAWHFVLALGCGGSQAQPQPTSVAEIDDPSAPAEEQAAEAPHEEAPHEEAPHEEAPGIALLVTGLQEHRGRVELITESPDPRWRSINSHHGRPCHGDCSGGSISFPPGGSVQTRLRCLRSDGRRHVVGSDLTLLDAGFSPVTTIRSNPRDERCEFHIRIEDRARDTEEITQFCWAAESSVSEAQARPCDFPEVTVPEHMELTVEEATFRPPPNLVMAGSTPDLPRLTVTLGLVFGSQPTSAIVGEAICLGAREGRWTNRLERELSDQNLPGEAGSLGLRFEFRGEDVEIATCHLLLSQQTEGRTRDLGTYCLRSPADQERRARERARRRRRPSKQSARSIPEELGDYGGGSGLARALATTRPFRVEPGTCRE
ncbi:MAG: hypothetical protein AAGE52_21595 [Myxococcota bacterium]